MRMEEMAGLAPPWQLLKRRDDRLRQIFDALLAAIKPSVVCDIGAFDGTETVRFQTLTPQSRFFLFEANSSNYESVLLKEKRLSSNRNTIIEHLAVTDRVGFADFNVLVEDGSTADWSRGAGSLLTRVESIPTTTETVKTTTLDHYFSSRVDIEQETFALWIDVEGALDLVLSGASKVLSRTVILRAEIECTEIWQGQKLAGDLKDAIEESGFVCLGDSFTPETHSQSDVLYVRPDLLNYVDPISNEA